MVLLTPPPPPLLLLLELAAALPLPPPLPPPRAFLKVHISEDMAPRKPPPPPRCFFDLKRKAISMHTILGSKASFSETLVLKSAQNKLKRGILRYTAAQNIKCELLNLTLAIYSTVVLNIVPSHFTFLAVNLNRDAL